VRRIGTQKKTPQAGLLKLNLTVLRVIAACLSEEWVVLHTFGSDERAGDDVFDPDPSGSIARSTFCRTGPYGEVTYFPDEAAVLSAQQEHLGLQRQAVKEGMLFAEMSGKTTLQLRRFIWEKRKQGTPDENLPLGHIMTVSACCFSHDGKLILSASFDKTLKLWCARTGGLWATLVGPTESVMDCCFSPCGTQIISASMDGTLAMWNIEDGGADHGVTLRREPSYLEGHSDGVSSCCFSADGKILSGSYDMTLKVWAKVHDNVDDSPWHDIITLCGHTGFVNSGCFSPDSLTILSASDDATLKLWDAKTGKILTTLVCGNRVISTVTCCQFSPCGDSVLSASSDKTLRLWDVASHQCLQLFEGHADCIQCCCFSPSGALILSGAHDGMLHVWNVKTGEVVHTKAAHVENDLIWSCCFSPEGECLLAGSTDSSLRLWQRHLL
jgi:WD40 repeat protein